MRMLVACALVLASGSLLVFALTGGTFLDSKMYDTLTQTDGAVALALFGCQSLSACVCAAFAVPVGACGVSFALHQSIGAWSLSRWAMHMHPPSGLILMVIVYGLGTIGLSILVAWEARHCAEVCQESRAARSRAERATDDVALGLPVAHEEARFESL